MRRHLSALTILFLIAAGFVLTKAQPVEAREAVVRVTTGSYENRGWEANLIRGNRNLSHFAWMPVTGYAQGTMRIRQPQGPNYDRLASAQIQQRRSVYSKPIHVPTMVVARCNRVAAVLVPTPGRNDLSGRLASHDVSGRLSSQNVNGRLASRDVSGRLAAREVAANLVARYPETYATISAADTGVGLYEKQVYARIRGARSF